MQVRVDQRSERASGLDAIVERQAQLAEQREVGAEAGGGDDLVGDELAVTVGEHDPRVTCRDRARLEPAGERDRAVLDQAADGRAESRRAPGSWSSPPPPYLRPGAPPRIAQTICVAGSESRSATRSRIALKAEWPLPTTSTRLPA